jgi:hypothetical protein
MPILSVGVAEDKLGPNHSITSDALFFASAVFFNLSSTAGSMFIAFLYRKHSFDGRIETFYN